MTDKNSDRTPASPDGDRAPQAMRWAARDLDALSSDERERLEAQSDVLIDLVGHAQRHRADSPAFDDPRFLEWYCAEQRANHEERPHGDAMDGAEVAALVLRMQAELEADALGVFRVDRSPAERPHESAAPASLMVDLLTGTGEAALADLSVAAGAGRALWDVECDTSVELPPHLAGGRYLALRVAGDSMTPLMHSGDVVLVKLGPDVRQDSVVVAHLGDHEYVVKRVGRITAATLELVSLNPAYPPVRVRRSSDRILGTVVLRWCGHAQA